MRYFELSFEMSPYNEAAADVLAALLADGGCDTFEPTASGLKAYALQDTYDEAAIQGAIATTTATFADEALIITYTCTEAPDENWNATWEAEHHFEPISLPDGQQLQIIPRQAFGSGEHATTRMILGLLAELPLAHTTVIDAGCGTGILGIAALKLGAARVFAYDIDEWSVRNAEENFELNGISVDKLAPQPSAFIALGDASCLAQAPQADILLANINRNILLADMAAFVAHIKKDGYILLSGFYEQDIQPLLECTQPLGLTLQATRCDGDWRALLLRK